MERNFKGVWIPKEIWLSKELTLQEKVFLVEIDSLDNDEGCFASNSYFADFFGISKARVSQVIKSLEEKGYITCTLEREGKEVARRVINCLIGSKFSKQGSKFSKQGSKFSKEGYLENYKDNNTIYNNIYNNTSSSSSNHYRHYNFVKEYQNKINATCSPLEIEKLSSYIDDGLEDELIVEAIHEAVLSNVRNYKYISKILDRCLDKGIKTVEQFRAEKRIKEAKVNGTKGNIKQDGDSYAGFTIGTVL